MESATPKEHYWLGPARAHIPRAAASLSVLPAQSLKTLPALCSMVSMVTAAVPLTTTSTECCGRHTSAVCRPEDVQAPHDQTSKLSAVGLSQRQVLRLWAPSWKCHVKFGEKATCTICRIHKHIHNTMTQPLWFLCSIDGYVVCLWVCMHAPSALYKWEYSLYMRIYVCQCVDIFIGANHNIKVIIKCLQS